MHLHGITMVLAMVVSTMVQSGSHKPQQGSNTAPNPGQPKKYLALGDSYTIGQSVGANERFPVQTENGLRATGVYVEAPTIIATTGWTTTDLMTALDQQPPGNDYDLVSLLIGVNDQYRFGDTTDYRNRFAALLAKGIGYAHGRPAHVVVLSIPDYSVTPFAMHSDTALIRKQIDAFNLVNREVTSQMGCGYLDITPSTRAAATDPSLLAPDGLHPSGKEYKKWADRLVPLFSAQL